MAHGRILFINASQKRDGNTVEYAQALLDGLDFERIDLVDYRMGFFGQDFADDQFEEVFQKMVESDTIVLGSPVYSETMSAAARLLLERLETRPQDDALAGRRFAFFIQSYGRVGRGVRGKRGRPAGDAPDRHRQRHGRAGRTP